MPRNGIVPRILLAVAIVSLAAGGRQAVGQETPRSAPSPGVGYDPDCPVCALWIHHEGALLRANLEIGALEDGAVYLFSADDFRTIEDLQAFAYARRIHNRRGLDRRHPRIRLTQGHRESPGEIYLEITTSPHGFFALVTSDNPVTVDIIRQEASRAVKGQTPVRF